MPSDQVDLRKDGERIRRAWLATDAPHAPLHLAAALAFHEAHGGVDAVVPRLDYDDALNLAAAALSRLLTLYTLDEQTRRPVPVRLSLANGRFRQGAVVYEQRESSRTVTSLVVHREQLPAAIAVIRATGLPLHFERAAGCAIGPSAPGYLGAPGRTGSTLAPSRKASEG